MANKEILSKGCDEYRGLFSKWMTKGANSLSDLEARALSEGAAGSGDVLFPTVFSNQFMAEMGDDQILSRVSKVVVNSGVVSVPVITPAGSGGFSVQKNPGEAGTLIDATASSQATVTVPSIALPGTSNTGSSTSTLRLKRVSVMVRVSNELLEDSAGQGDASVESFIVRQAAQDIAAQLNKQILVGNKDDSVTAGTASTAGSDSCHGVLQTCRRYSRGFTSTQIFGTSTSSLSASNNFSNWIIGQVRANRFAAHYWARAMVVFNSQINVGSSAIFAGVGMFTGSQIATAMTYGSPAGIRTVLGLPWTFSDMSIANTGDSQINNGNEPLSIMCDFSRYLFVTTSEGVSIARIGERYAESNETMFVVSMRCAGVLVDPNAAISVMV